MNFSALHTFIYRFSPSATVFTIQIVCLLELSNQSTDYSILCTEDLHNMSYNIRTPHIEVSRFTVLFYNEPFLPWLCDYPRSFTYYQLHSITTPRTDVMMIYCYCRSTAVSLSKGSPGPEKIHRESTVRDLNEAFKPWSSEAHTLGQQPSEGSPEWAEKETETEEPTWAY